MDKALKRTSSDFSGPRRKIDLFFWLTLSCSALIIAFIILPLAEMIFQPTVADLIETINDKDVVKAIWLSIYTATLSALLVFLLGTPFAYLIARKAFPGKKLVESIIDLPIMIPHPVIGIAILSMAGRDHWLGKIMDMVGLRIMGSVTGIIMVMAFVGLPFYINTVKDCFEAIPVRLENVSRSLGASPFATFYRVTFPLAQHGRRNDHVHCKGRQRIRRHRHRGVPPHGGAGNDL
jgi:molybdate/tungstate transport system permease protein